MYIEFRCHNLRLTLEDLGWKLVDEEKKYMKLRIQFLISKYLMLLNLYISFLQTGEISDDYFWQHMIESGQLSDFTFNLFWKQIKKEFQYNFPALNIKSKKDFKNYFNNYNNWRFPTWYKN